MQASEIAIPFPCPAKGLAGQVKSRDYPRDQRHFFWQHFPGIHALETSTDSSTQVLGHPTVAEDAVFHSFVQFLDDWIGHPEINVRHPKWQHILRKIMPFDAVAYPPVDNLVKIVSHDLPRVC